MVSTLVRGPDVVVAAPGAGLGHLARTTAVCLSLEERGVSCRLVTHSPHAPGLAALTGLAIDRIPSRRWSLEAPGYAARLRPAAVVLDTFPWGIRGEWRMPPAAGMKYILLARRLNVGAYLSAARLDWRAGPHLERIIRTEPLNEDYLERLQAAGDVLTLPGRIRFPAESFSPLIPKELECVLDSGRLTLVVHSGPKSELARLVALARDNMDEKNGPLAVISPRGIDGSDCPVHSLFPAAGLYGRARRVVTGGGYGSLADMAGRREKHVAHPFPRRYDDQVGRLNGPDAGNGDGRAAAADLIADWL